MRIACLLDQVRYACAAGIDAVQLREADLDDRDLMAIVRSALAIARESQTRIIVNDRLDVALAAGAAGVHLKANSMAASMVRRTAPPGFVIGQSVHSIEEAKEAGSADYLIAGTVWSSESKHADHQCIGPEGLTAIVRVTRLPTLAIGGVSMDRIGAVREAGADGVAAIGLFMASRRADSAGFCRAGRLERVVDEARRAFDSSGSAS